MRAAEQVAELPCMGTPSRTLLSSVAALLSRPPGCAATLSDGDVKLRQLGVAWALNSLVPPPLELIAMSGPRRKEEPPDVRGVLDVLRALCLGTPPPVGAVHAAAMWWEEDTDAPLRLLRRTTECALEPVLAAPATAPAAAPVQPLRLPAPLAKLLLASTGRALAAALEGAREAAHIFALMAVAAELGTASAAAIRPDAPPAEWLTAGEVAAASGRALERAQSALMERSLPIRLFTPRLLVAAQALGAAASAEHSLSTASDPLSDTPLQLRHALYAAAETLHGAAQSARVEPVSADNLFYEEDDFGGPSAAARPARGAAGTQRTQGLPDAATQAGLDGGGAPAAGPLEICIGVIAALGIARPATVADALLGVLNESPADLLQPGVTDAALEALCSLRHAPSSALVASMSALTAALAAATSDDAERTVWLLRLLCTNAQLLRESLDALGDSDMPDAAGASSAQRSPTAAYLQLCDCVRSSAGELRACGLAAGMLLADAVCSLLRAVPQPPECLTAVAVQLVGDARYAVRRAMAARFGDVLSNFAVEAHRFILNDVKPSLAGLPPPADAEDAHLLSLFQGEGEQLARHETTLLFLGEVAAASPPLEADCIFDIMSVAVDRPCHTRVALRVLTATAKRLGYSSRFGLVAQHVHHIAFKWANSGRNVDSMLHVGELLAPRADLVAGNALVGVYARYLLPRLVESNDAASVSRIASLCSMDDRKLFQQHGARTLASLHALRANGGERGTASFARCISSPTAVVVVAYGGPPHIGKAYSGKGASIVRELLLLARGGGAEVADDRQLLSVQPVLSVKEVLAGVADLEKMYGNDSAAKVMAVLWSGEKVLQHLLDLHEMIGSAKAPRHRAAWLESLSALLQLLVARNLVRRCARQRPQGALHAACAATRRDTD